MTDYTAQYHDQSYACGNAADVLTELVRFLGPLAADVSPAVNIRYGATVIYLYAHRAPNTELRGSAWHKAVTRLSEMYGPALITRGDRSVTAVFNTPFAVRVDVSTRNPVDAHSANETTLEAVLA